MRDILVAATGGLVGAIAAFAISYATAENSVPLARLAPSSITVAPGKTIDFDASASIDHDGKIEVVSWQVNGQSDLEGKEYRCMHPEGDDRKLSCTFHAGFHHTVSIAAQDDDGALDTAVATVQVAVSPYFLAFFLAKDVTDTPQVKLALYHAIDWNEVTNLVGHPIYFVDPTGRSGIRDAREYAFEPDKSKELIAQAGFKQTKPISLVYGLELAPAIDVIQKWLKAIGIEVVFVNPSGAGGIMASYVEGNDGALLAAKDPASLYSIVGPIAETTDATLPTPVGEITAITPQ